MADSDSTIGSSQNYTTTQSWFDTKDGETGTHTGRVKDEVLDGALTANNASTAATAFILVPQSAHNGQSREVTGAGSTLQHTARVIWWFSSNGATITVRDMVLQQPSGTTTVVAAANGGGDTTWERCIVYKTNAGSATGYCMDLRGNGGDHSALDCLVYGNTTMGIDQRGPTGGILSGNTVYGGTYGILPSTVASNTVEVHNNIAVNQSTESFFSADAADSNHGGNIADDASADTEWNGAGSSHNSVEVLDNATSPTPTADYVCFEDLTGGSEDFSLVDLEHVTHNPVAIGGGLASKGTGTGVNGVARDGTNPDVGAFETAAAGGFVPYPINRPNMQGGMA